ncbi:adenosine deaminase [Cladophialophora carrionii CBS 160.54]|uniref:Adenine deaminase n=1 Tax=Cladophialophora carrionii CBS 160.54 TaxID=1279043 RepID=V9DAY7_9EURO|nr:adenosine deaminase [Cladophialophora carrionii CBS 160.54]ETI24005.1 adenosine deaminase [Cladophialophora carrionii CBS 160.54]
MASQTTTQHLSPTMDLPSFISALPKAELHVHLEGCLTPSLARSLAARNNLPLPPSLSALDQTGSTYSFHDLTTFLQVYYPNLSVLQTAQDFADLAVSYLTVAHAQNVKHCELFFDPQAHTSRGVPFPTVVRGYQAGIQTAQRGLGISASLIMCFLRDHSAEYAMATLMSSLPFKDVIIGVGLDSDERDNPPAKFAAVFQRAAKEGFLITMHCDIDQPNTLTHIGQAINEIQVDRIDHGTNIVDSPELISTLKQRGIGLTACPISNSIVTDDFKGKEIIDLLRQGVRVTVNSDDPAYFRGYVNENMLKLASAPELNVTRKELIQLQRNAFTISWISSWKRNHFLQLLDEFERLTLGSEEAQVPNGV